MIKLNCYLKGIWGQVKAGLKRFSRDRMALFFTFLFPLIFLLVFGSIFNNQSTSFDIAIINHSSSDLAHTFIEAINKDSSKTLRIKTVASFAEAQDKLRRSNLNGILELDADFGSNQDSLSINQVKRRIKLFYAKGQDQAGATLGALIKQIIDQINNSLGHPEAPLKVELKSLGDEALRTFDYTFTGLLAFSLMSMGVFGLANQMPSEKEKGTYRRLRAAPFSSGQLIISVSIVYTLVALISALSMLLVGKLIFSFSLRGDYLLFGLFLTSAAVMMVGLGLMVGAWAKNEKQSAPLANLVAFPMMFLSGAFFPTFLFPEWLAKISRFIPMTHIVDGFRLIMTERATLPEVLPQFGLIAIFIILVYFLAIKLFRWE